MPSARLPAPPSDEVALLLACCRPPSADRDEAIAALLPVARPETFVTLARRHRVQGLILSALQDAAIQSQALQPVVRDARGIATEALRLAGESARLVGRLRAAGIPVIVLKGSPLAMSAYGTLTTKMAWDIDLLVPATALRDAAAALSESGYRCERPGGDRGTPDRSARPSKDSTWHHPGRDIYLELHTALFSQPQPLAGTDPFEAPRHIAVAPGLELPTLRDELQFAYLCVHGAVSGWRRAKWLADLAAWSARRSAAEVERMYRWARDAGAGRAPGQALLLMNRYLAVPFADDLLKEIERDALTMWMSRIAAKLLTAENAFDDPAEKALSTLPIHMTDMLLMPGWRYFGQEGRRKIALAARNMGMLR